MTEMTDMCNGGHDTWLTRVTQIERHLNLPRMNYFSKTSGKAMTSCLKSKFDRFWLDKIKTPKIGTDGLDHNKLRTYKNLKASFTREPYLDLIRNRNQRSFLSRLRVSSHNLAIERGRYTRPVTPIEQRFCTYCKPTTTRPSPPGTPPTPPWCTAPRRTSTTAQADTEFHFLLECPMFEIERNCLFGKMSSIEPDFTLLKKEEKFVKLLGPTNVQMAKLSKKLIKIMFEARNKLDLGQTINQFE